MTNYSNAAAYERALVTKLLTDDECLYATRTPGSRSPIDVIALFIEDGILRVHLIQCKNGTSRPKFSEIDFLRFAREYGCDCYFMSSTNPKSAGKNKRKYNRYELEDIEDGALGRPINNGKKEDT